MQAVMQRYNGFFCSTGLAGLVQMTLWPATEAAVSFLSFMGLTADAPFVFFRCLPASAANRMVVLMYLPLMILLFLVDWFCLIDKAKMAPKNRAGNRINGWKKRKGPKR